MLANGVAGYLQKKMCLTRLKAVRGVAQGKKGGSAGKLRRRSVSGKASRQVIHVFHKFTKEIPAGKYREIPYSQTGLFPIEKVLFGGYIELGVLV
jgi:hypothetical protein